MDANQIKGFLQGIERMEEEEVDRKIKNLTERATKVYIELNSELDNVVSRYMQIFQKIFNMLEFITQTFVRNRAKDLSNLPGVWKGDVSEELLVRSWEYAIKQCLDLVVNCEKYSPETLESNMVLDFSEKIESIARMIDIFELSEWGELKNVKDSDIKMSVIRTLGYKGPHETRADIVKRIFEFRHLVKYLLLLEPVRKRLVSPRHVSLRMCQAHEMLGDDVNDESNELIPVSKIMLYLASDMKLTDYYDFVSYYKGYVTDDGICVDSTGSMSSDEEPIKIRTLKFPIMDENSLRVTVALGIYKCEVEAARPDHLLNAHAALVVRNLNNKLSTVSLTAEEQELLNLGTTILNQEEKIWNWTCTYIKEGRPSAHNSRSLHPPVLGELRISDEVVITPPGVDSSQII